MAPEDDPGWERYPYTILELLSDRSVELDLTKTVPTAALARLAAHGVGPTFAVVTACNPRGQTMREDANRRLDEQLHRDVMATGQPSVAADGLSLDRSHREIGLAVSIPKEDAQRLARTYGQSAFFWFDGSAMWIVGALVDTPDIRLPK